MQNEKVGIFETIKDILFLEYQKYSFKDIILEVFSIYFQNGSWLKFQMKMQAKTLFQ